jgi:hypothetical protein
VTATLAITTANTEKCLLAFAAVRELTMFMNLVCFESRLWSSRENIFSFALTLLSVDSIAKFVSAFTGVFLTLFTKHNIHRRTDSLLQSKDFMVADEICCAGKLAELTSETYHKGDVKCRDFDIYMCKRDYIIV